MKSFLEKYKHAWILLYFPLYLIAFFLLEQRKVYRFYVFQTVLDKQIPFLEIFIIPYLLWFAYVAVGVIYFFFTDVKGYYRLMTLLCIGMTFFLVWSYFVPNGLLLRPTLMEKDNIFIRLVEHLYNTDTSTNVFPSIHVYNSLGIMIAAYSSERLRNRKPVYYGVNVLGILIILSTVFIKQHSLLDVAGAFVLAVGSYWLVYDKGYLYLEKWLESRKYQRGLKTLPRF